MLVPLYFIKFIIGIGHFPSADGGIIEIKKFYHSPFENLTDMGCIWLMYASLALISASAVLSALGLVRKDSTKLHRASLYFFILSVVISALTVLFSTTVGRGY